MEISKTTIGIAAGVAGTLFLGYCIYFDHKRRKDPDFKKKLRESPFVHICSVRVIVSEMAYRDQGGKLKRQHPPPLEVQGQPCRTWQITRKCKGIKHLTAELS
uniref:Mitochondrial import receptor subunit TOM20 homolog n=1 Tax=Culex pipiens TaxID=7175 RepID=A0A8D8F1Z3_CULPI